MTLVDEFSFKTGCYISENDARTIISHIHHLEPCGVASANILEYYLIQALQKGEQNIPAGTTYVLNHYFQRSAKRQMERS